MVWHGKGMYLVVVEVFESHSHSFPCSSPRVNDEYLRLIVLILQVAVAHFQRALKAPAQAMLILLAFPSNNSRSWIVILTPGVVKFNGMWAPNMKLPQVTTKWSQYQWHPMVLIASKVSLFIVAVQFCIHKMQQLSSLHPNLSGFLLRKPLYSAGGSDIEKGLSRFQRKASTQPVLADRSPNGCHLVPLPIMPHLLLFPNSWSLSFHKRLSNLETSTNWHPKKTCHAKFMNSTAFITYCLCNIHFSSLF